MKVGLFDETIGRFCVRGRLFDRHSDEVFFFVFRTMNKQYQSKKKQKSNQAEETDDDEQIEKTLNFLDAIIDQYLNDENVSFNFQGFIYQGQYFPGSCDYFVFFIISGSSFYI
jgi:hypothetical protein